MSKQEQFFVRICGCHRGQNTSSLPFSWTTRFIHLIGESRVDAVRLMERIGNVPERDKYKVKAFLEGNVNEFIIVTEDSFCSTMDGTGHVAVINRIDER